MVIAKEISVALIKTGDVTKNENPIWSGYLCYNNKPVFAISVVETKKELESRAGKAYTKHSLYGTVNGDEIELSFDFPPRGKKEDGTDKAQMVVGNISGFAGLFMPVAGFLNEEKQSVKLKFSEYAIERNNTIAADPDPDKAKYAKEYILEEPGFNLDQVTLEEIATEFPEFDAWHIGNFPSSGTSKEIQEKNDRVKNILALAKQKKVVGSGVQW